jgi:Uma2 family endonuclease
MQVSRRISVREAMSRTHHDDWNLTEDHVPESIPHDRVSDRLKNLLVAWSARTGRSAQIGRNLAVRWDETRPSIGVDPDVYVLMPPPVHPEETSLRLWQEGHHPLLLAIEVVSASRPDKDYSQSPEKYAVNGTEELWVLDPKLAGPRTEGGPFRIQLWRRAPGDTFDQIYAGEGPVWSPAVQGWLFAVEEARSLSIADDAKGTSWWMTGEEAERAAKEDALRREQAERAAKEDALRRLEALQRRLEGGPPGSGVTGPSDRER